MDGADVRLTAPALRLQWLAFGWVPNATMDQTNQVIVMYLVPQTIFIMALWMRTVGDRDLGLLPAKSIVPGSVLRLLSILVTLVVFHEAVLVPFGLDVLRSWRGSAFHLPRIGIVWALATASVALRAPADLLRLGQGDDVRLVTRISAIVAACGSLLVAYSYGGTDLTSLARASFFAAWGVHIMLLLALGRNAGPGRSSAWDMQWIYLAFVPALWPLLAPTFIPLGVGAPVVMTVAMGNAYATIAVLGFASAFGLQVLVTAPARAAA